MNAHRLVALCFTALVAACGDGTFSLQLVYPSQQLFDRGRTVELFVGEGYVCSALQAAPGAPRLVFDSHATSPEVGQVAAGRVAFLALVRDGDCQRFLDGCTETTIDRGVDNAVEIELTEVSATGCSAGERCVQARCVASDASIADAAAVDRRDAALPDVDLDAARPDIQSDAARLDSALDAAPDAARPDVATDGGSDAAIADGAVADVAVPRRGLIGEWLFDEATGSTVHDSSGLGSDGTFFGTPVWASGRLGGGVAFHYQDDVDGVLVAGAPALQSVQGGSYTISAWFKPASIPPASDTVNHHDDGYALVARTVSNIWYTPGQEFGWQIHLVDTAPWPWPNVAGGPVSPPGSWQHVVALVDRSAAEIEIWIAGARAERYGFDGGMAAAFDGGSAPWYFGTRPPTRPTYRYSADGTIDLVRIYDRVLTPAEIQALAAENPCRGSADASACPGGVCEGEVCVAIPRRGLVGEWLLDEISGTVAHDSSGHGSDGTFYGSPSWAPGKIGGAIAVHYQDGIDYVRIADTATLANVHEGSFTIAAWFRPDTVPPWLDRTDDNDEAYAVVGKMSNAVYFRYNHQFWMQTALASGSYPNATGGPSCDSGTWYHVAGVLDRPAGDFRVWVNGVSGAVGSFAPGAASKDYGAAPWLIGARQLAGDNGYRYDADGTIDQVRIYDRALGAAEIAALAAEGAR